MSKSILKKLQKTFPKIEEGHFYKNGSNVFVTKSALSKILGVSSWTIIDYEKKGLKRYEDSPNMLPLYELTSSILFKQKIKSKHAKNKGNTENTAPISKNLDIFLNSLPLYKREIFELSELDYMDRLAKLRDIEKKETANLKEREQLIDKDDVDKNMTTLAGLLTASLINYEDSAPAELENKSKEEIAKLIYLAHKDVFNELDRVINKHFECNESFYDVMAVALKQINNGATPLELVERLNVDSSK